MSVEDRLGVISALCLLAFLILGLGVSHAQAQRLDLAGSVFRGASTPIALAFTDSARGPALAVLGIISIAAYAFARQPIWIPVGIAISQMASQGFIELAKRLFHRTRPDDWLVTHEFGWSYPSGHAATTMVFFGAWIVVLSLSPIPRVIKFIAIVLIIAWIIGIDWSRLALAAHYVTDVLGGTLFGAGWLFLVLRFALPFLQRATH
jgi:undecaprenyl-diphosphatase